MPQGNMDTLSWCIRNPHEVADKIELTDAQIGRLLDLAVGQREEIARLKRALKEIDRLAVAHKRGAIGEAQRIARDALAIGESVENGKEAENV